MAFQRRPTPRSRALPALSSPHARLGQRHRVRSSIVLLGCLLAWAATAAVAVSADRKPSILGTWRLDDALTAAAQPVEGQRSSAFEGFSVPSITVNGMPLPGTGGGAAPARAGGSASDPKILRCARMLIDVVGEDLQLTYVGVGSETLTPGRSQGITTRWTGDSLRSSYETTSRRVSKRLSLQKDGTLLVTVKLDPSSGPAVTHKRVFRREVPAITPG